MSFRERPEYKEWRDAVVTRFGQSCIACGHSGNIHIHHVLPVATYPEFAFDPDNGVPLCGNCHAEVTGQEMAYVDQLRELQQRALGVDQESPLTIDDLRQAAVADPSDSVAVTTFLNHVDDSHEAVRFYANHQKAIHKTPELAFVMARHLREADKYEEAIAFADEALNLAKNEGGEILHQSLCHIAYQKVQCMEALGSTDELISYLEELVAEFDDYAELHRLLSLKICRYLRDQSLPVFKYPEECVAHAQRAAHLAPRDPTCLGWASHVCAVNGLLKDAMRLANDALAYAKDQSEKITALDHKVLVFKQSELYGDAIAVCRDILGLDAVNVKAMSDIAHCLDMQGKHTAAVDMARRCLLYDPDNESAMQTLESCEQGGGF